MSFSSCSNAARCAAKDVAGSHTSPSRDKSNACQTCTRSALLQAAAPRIRSRLRQSRASGEVCASAMYVCAGMCWFMLASCVSLCRHACGCLSVEGNSGTERDQAGY
ncbi:hypothetical protein BCR37DRAFT_379947 [Protomyces lactucae-debilis]|uniref:Uncharacterized protein n=1 Tax=Protomyces lactucae-debilis TaxID=2754530 RepID=A0A1Y2FDM4_PROLT|nr:uncharacterized protein BCR37DRAFT_379947 [Protomyces lactucae-debilis]ORY82028.1 hypothetical protein BCR37DRAFT_379947 [Protomyces lactucae-debilis]